VNTIKINVASVSISTKDAFQIAFVIFFFLLLSYQSYTQEAAKGEETSATAQIMFGTETADK